MVYKFDNGLKLVHRYLPHVRSVAACVMTGVGSGNETAENNGISHFIEHMVFKGTARRSCFDITKEIDDIGAQINAFTSKQATCYYTVGIDEYVEECMDILGDIYFNSTFPEDEMEKEKGVVLEEIAMGEDDPSGLCLDNLSAAYFEGHPLGLNIIGDRETVLSFTRQQIIDYMSEHYCATNSVISIVGNIEFEKAKELAGKYFASKYDCTKVFEWQDAPHITASTSIDVIKDIEQANVGIILPGIARFDPLDPAMSVFNTIFGSGMSSRLFQEIREKQGLAYSVFSYPSSYSSNGNVSIYLGTNLSSVEKAVRSVKAEMDKLKKEGFTAEEVERGKRQMKGAYILGQESTSSMMRMYARHALFTQEFFDFDKHIEDINKVTSEEIEKLIDIAFDYEKASSAYVAKVIDCDVLDVFKKA